jgi:hypothetical protein
LWAQFSAGNVQVVIKDYLKAGDSLTVATNAATDRIGGVTVATITDSAKHAVGLKVASAHRPWYGSPPMRTVTDEDPISLDELRHLAAGRFGDLVKAVVDVERGIMVVDADLHADQEAELLGSGSQQQDVWGINLYPDLPEGDWLEFDSMINLRPSFGNRSRGVDAPAVRERITRLVVGLVRR